MAGKESEILRNFDTLIWDEYVVSKRREPITQWRYVMPLIKHRAVSTYVGADFFFVPQQPKQHRLIFEILDHTLLNIQARTHPVGPLWTSDQPVGRSRYLHNTQQTKEKNIHVLGGNRTRDPSNRAFADLRFRSRGHQDRRNRDIATRLLKCRNRCRIILKRTTGTVGD